MRSSVCLRRRLPIVLHQSQPRLHLQFLLPLQVINLQQAVRWSELNIAGSLRLVRSFWMSDHCESVVPVKASLPHAQTRGSNTLFYSTWDDTIAYLTGVITLTWWDVWMLGTCFLLLSSNNSIVLGFGSMLKIISCFYHSSVWISSSSSYCIKLLCITVFTIRQMI